MKLQKVMLILSISTCLVGTQVVPAVAQEGQVVEGVQNIDEAVAEADAEQPAAPEAQPSAPAETPAQPSAPATPAPAPAQPSAPTDNGASAAGQNTAEAGENTAGTTADGETQTGSNDQDPSVGTTGESQDNEDNTGADHGDQTSQDNAGESDLNKDGKDGAADEDQNDNDNTGKGNADKGGEAKDGKDNKSNEKKDNNDNTDKDAADKDHQDNTGKEKEDTTDKDNKNTDNKNTDSKTNKDTNPIQEAINNAVSKSDKTKADTQLRNVANQSKKTEQSSAANQAGKRSSGNYRQSAKFLDDREKIKYNVEVPLDGFPSFITSEMIVGALKCQDETGYPASVTIAQIIAESGYGKYGPGGDRGQGLSYLAYQYNNLFGIKGTGPAGSANMRTGEQAEDGSRYTINAGFRAYNTYSECIQDRADLLGRVYKDLTFGVTDANTFAMKIGGRWATDLDYGETLIRLMERYNLYRLDELTVGEFSELLGTFVNPCPGARLTSTFGYRNAPTEGASTYHKGIDLGTGSENIPTYAAAEGTVIFAGEAGGAGNLITIDHGDGLVTKYMHHDKIYVQVGDVVEKGQQIGLSGTTGISTGNHLHFQVEKDGVAVDPMDYLAMERPTTVDEETKESIVDIIKSKIRSMITLKTITTTQQIVEK